ncbi:hypothetical protein DDP54_04220 [Cellulomonas sp. WB94]|uniref:GGDEF domain-containing protein n=1 Tax=Cellulomonas sp. WB94 TaxID=2173174 RepID=UPI000D57AEFE|nr:GGDEF domain-containing protein [Cellulomonas sp. WB94]PVU82331.1 hypothetical protein DDP54_04220 [Cellulomonas sp. WB94]
MGDRGHVSADGLASKVTLPLGYALLLAAAIGILSPFVRRDLSGLIDAAVMWLASASVLWAVVLHPTLVRSDVGPGDRAYTLLLVLLVSGLAGMVLQAAVGNRAARPALLYLSVAVILTLAGNIARAMTFDPATRTSATWIGLVRIAHLAQRQAAAERALLLLATRDELGHNAGDEVLVGVAGRLVGSVGPDALASRFGGDEFIVIDDGPPDGAAGRIDDVRRALDLPLLIGGAPVQVGASIGVHEIGPGSSVTAAQVIAEADRRMYADKRLRARTT